MGRSVPAKQRHCAGNELRARQTHRRVDVSATPEMQTAVSLRRLRDVPSSGCPCALAATPPRLLTREQVVTGAMAIAFWTCASCLRSWRVTKPPMAKAHRSPNRTRFPRDRRTPPQAHRNCQTWSPGSVECRFGRGCLIIRTDTPYTRGLVGIAFAVVKPMAIDRRDLFQRMPMRVDPHAVRVDW